MKSIPERVKMTFSIVVPTIGRQVELDRLFFSLAQQTYKDFEVIIIDQNKDNRLDDIVFRWKNQFPINHLKPSLIVGSSAARNASYAYIHGQIVTFCDDDCWYDVEILDTIQRMINDHQVISTNIKLWNTKGSGRLKLNPRNVWITKYFLFNNFMEATLFFKRDLILKYKFDESVGIGSSTMRWSDEGADLLVRMMADGIKPYHYGRIYINHPDSSVASSVQNDRAYRYGLGRGCFLRRNRYALIYVLLMSWIPYLFLMVLNIFRLRPTFVRYYWRGLSGRVFGFFSLPKRDFGGGKV